MAGFDYKTTFITREATLARLEDLDAQITELDEASGNTMAEELAHNMMDNLMALKRKLVKDLSYFGEVDRATA